MPAKASPTDRDLARRAAARAERDRRRRRAGIRRRVRTAAISIAAVALVGVLGYSFAREASGGVTFEGDLRAGGRIEQLRLPALEGGGDLDYGATYASRPLVINFFASWCPNCIAEMPDFERVHQASGGEVAFLGVSQSDAPQASIDLAAETGITYDTAIDRQGAFFNAIGASGMPTTVFVRPGGEIAQVWVGALDEASLRQLIDEYLGVVV